MNILGSLGSRFASGVVKRRAIKLNQTLEKVRRQRDETAELKMIANRIAAAKNKLRKNQQALSAMQRAYMKAVMTRRRKNIYALRQNRDAIRDGAQVGLPTAMNKIAHNSAQKQNTQLARVNANVLGSKSPNNQRVNIGSNNKNNNRK